MNIHKKKEKIFLIKSHGWKGKLLTSVHNNMHIILPLHISA